MSVYSPRPRTNARVPQFSAKGLFISFAAAAGLSACTTPAVVKDRIVEIRVPVAVVAITPDQVPIAPPPLGPRPQSLSAAADALLAAHCQFVAYVLVADPLLHISAGEKAVALNYPECAKR